MRARETTPTNDIEQAGIPIGLDIPAMLTLAEDRSGVSLEQISELTWDADAPASSAGVVADAARGIPWRFLGTPPAGVVADAAHRIPWRCLRIPPAG